MTNSWRVPSVAGNRDLIPPDRKDPAVAGSEGLNQGRMVLSARLPNDTSIACSPLDTARSSKRIADQMRQYFPDMIKEIGDVFAT